MNTTQGAFARDQVNQRLFAALCAIEEYTTYSSLFQQAFHMLKQWPALPLQQRLIAPHSG